MRKLMVLLLTLAMLLGCVPAALAAEPSASGESAENTQEQQTAAPFKLGGGDKDNVEDGVVKEKVESIVLNFAPGDTGFAGEPLETVTFTLSNGASAVAPSVNNVVESDGFVSRSFLNWQCPTDGNRSFIIEPGEALNFEALELKVRKASMTTKKELVFNLNPVFRENLPDRSASFDPMGGKWEDEFVGAKLHTIPAEGSTVAPTVLPPDENTKFLHWQAVDASGAPIEGMTLNAGESVSYRQLDSVYADKDRSYVQQYKAVFGEKKFEIQSIAVDFDPSPAKFSGAGNNARTFLRGDKTKTRIPSADGIHDEDRFLTHKFVEWVYGAEGKTITLSFGADETMSFDLLERKLLESGMTLTENMTLNFTATFEPVERSRLYIYVLNKSSGRFADGYTGTSRAESVSASAPQAACAVIPTNPKQVLSHWQGLDTTEKNKPIPGLTFRPGEMITYERLEQAMSGKRGDAFVQFIPVFEEKITVNVEFLYNGKRIGGGKLDVPKDSTSVVNGQLAGLKLPDVFALDQTVQSYPIDHGKVMVPVVDAVRDITVTFKTEDGNTVGTQVLENVPLRETSVTVTAPENYELVGKAEVPVRKDTMALESVVRVKTQSVTLTFVENKKQIGEPVNLVLPVTQTQLTAEEVKALTLPARYALADAAASYTITEGAVKVPVVEMTRDILVRFVTEDKTEVGTQTLENVKYSAETVTVTVPEGYETVAETNVVPVTAEMETVEVLVRKATEEYTFSFWEGEKQVGEAVVRRLPMGIESFSRADLADLTLPQDYALDQTVANYPVEDYQVKVPVVEKTRSITVTYKTEEGEVVATETAGKIPYSARTLKVKAPKDCALITDTDVVDIDRDTTQVVVFVKRTVQIVTVQFMDGRKKVGDPVQVKLPADKTALSAREVKDLKLKLPANYKVVEKDEYKIEDGMLKLPVKYQKPANSPQTGDEFPMTALLLLAASSAAAVAFLLLRKRRKV